MRKQKKKTRLTSPKPRGVWRINPKTRVEKSKKTYSRSEERKKTRRVTDKLDWFGEKRKSS